MISVGGIRRIRSDNQVDRPLPAIFFIAGFFVLKTIIMFSDELIEFLRNCVKFFPRKGEQFLLNVRAAAQLKRAAQMRKTEAVRLPQRVLHAGILLAKRRQQNFERVRFDLFAQ